MRPTSAVLATLLMFTGQSTLGQDKAAAPALQTGETPATAIVIDAASSAQGVPLEYEWIESKLPRARIERKVLLHIGGRTFDRFDVVLASGERRSVYFDITGFYGKRR